MPEVLRIIVQCRSLWLYAFSVTVGSGFLSVLQNNIATNFFAQRYTLLPADEIHCDTTPDESYCKSAVNDFVAVEGPMAMVTPIFALIVGPTVGALSDTFGRKWVTIACSTAIIIPWLAFIAHTQFNASLWGYFILSPLYALPTGALSLNIAADLVPEEKRRATVYSLNRACCVISSLMGIVISGNTPINTSMILASVIHVGGVVYAILCLPETLPKERRSPLELTKFIPGVGMKILCRNQMLMFLTTTIFFSSFLDGGFLMIWVPWLQKYLYVAANTKLSSLISYAAIVGNVCVLPILSSTYYDEVALVFSSRLASVLFCCWFNFLASPSSTYLGVAIFVPFINLMYPAIASMMSKLVGGEEQGAMQAALNTVTIFGTSLAPLVYAQLFTSFGSPDERTPLVIAPFLGSVAFNVPCLICCAVLPRKLRSYGYNFGTTQVFRKQDELTTPLILRAIADDIPETTIEALESATHKNPYVIPQAAQCIKVIDNKCRVPHERILDNVSTMEEILINLSKKAGFDRALFLEVGHKQLQEVDTYKGMAEEICSSMSDRMPNEIASLVTLHFRTKWQRDFNGLSDRLQNLIRSTECQAPLALQHGCRNGRDDVTDETLGSPIIDVTPQESTAGTLEGTWKAHAYEGDIDGFMREINIGWVARRAASAMNWGVGAASQQIKIDGNRVTFQGVEDNSTVTTYIVGGGWQEIPSDFLGPLRVLPSWVDDGKSIFCHYTGLMGELPSTKKLCVDSHDEFLEINALPSGTQYTMKWSRDLSRMGNASP